MMKYHIHIPALIVIAIALLSIPSIVTAQVPQTLSYQGVITTDGGQPVDDGDYSIHFRLYTGPESGEPLWSETQTVNVANGLFSVLLGSAAPLDLPFDQPYYLGVTIGEASELTPRTALASSAYSLRARAIDDGQAVKSINEMTDSVTIEAGSNVSITTADNRIIISAVTDSSAGDQLWQRNGDNIFNVNSGKIGIGTQNGGGKLTIVNAYENIMYGLAVEQTGAVTEGAILGTGGFTGVTGSAGFDIGGVTTGVRGTSGSESGRGVYGRAIHATGNNYGVIGYSSSSNGKGVYGEAAAGSGLTFGVQGLSNSTTGRGVSGVASAASGTNYGVWGESQSPEGRGVYGEASASSGINFGVFGRSQSTSGLGVYGQATASSGTTYGVWGASQSTDGQGVYGLANAPSGTTNGVSGRSFSTDGRGVFGEASASSGNTFGVYGLSFSTNGRGVFGEARASSGTTFGVAGRSISTEGRGIYGDALAASGNTFGVYGRSLSTDGRGVYGLANATSGTTYGVWGHANSSSGTGVYGRTSSITGQTIAVRGAVDSPEGYSAYFNGVAGSKNYFERWVGIGTNTPDAMLHLQDAGDEISIKLKAGGSWTAQIQQTNSSYLNFYNGGNVRMTIRAGGQVGIGTEEPGSFHLAVNGDAAKPGGGSWSVFSDERLKRDIQKIESGVLDRLLSIQGYTFNYMEEAVEKRLALPGRQTGLIAQEVLEVFPEWVGTDEEGYLYVTERGLTALLIEALRELKSEKDKEINALHQRVQLLELHLLQITSTE